MKHNNPDVVEFTMSLGDGAGGIGSANLLGKMWRMAEEGIDRWHPGCLLMADH